MKKTPKKHSNNFIQKIRNRTFFLSTILPLLIGGAFYLVISYLYYQQIASFLFFDEYANIIAGYLMTQGRSLYTENFFNHQMLPAYISYMIQLLSQPDSLFQLIAQHRIFIIIMSAILGSLLILRIGWAALVFVLLYEPVKYYLFGNLFIAESYIVYLLVYLVYIAWQKIQHEKIAGYDYILASISAWIVIFSREPYAPLALFLFLFILAQKRLPFSREKVIAAAIFVIATILILSTVSLPEYIYQVVYVNYMTVFQDQLSRNASSGLGIMAILFYPIFVFFTGQQTFMLKMLQIVSAGLIISLSLYLWRTKKLYILLFVFIVLAFANVRVLFPGIQFYSAFYQIQWFGLVSFCLGLLMMQLFAVKRSIMWVLLGVIFVATSGAILSEPDYFAFQKEQQQHLFAYNYDSFYVTGQAIQMMATEQSRLFVDLSDSLLFWTAQIPSSYKYGVYYPVAHVLPKYNNERMSMFQSAPPDFYYTHCLEGKMVFQSLPASIKNMYTPLTFEGGPSCLYVRKALFQTLSEMQLQEVRNLRFSFSTDNKNTIMNTGQ